MPLDSISVARLQSVCPVLADKITQMSVMLEQESIVIRVVQGLRTWPEQDALYAQGRTTPGKIVTNVKGGQSWHNMGLAVDCVPSAAIAGSAYVPDWNSEHPSWRRMIAVGQSLGLESGSSWRTFPDQPHFQLQGRFPIGAPNDEVREIFRNVGMTGVWVEAGIGYVAPDSPSLTTQS